MIESILAIYIVAVTVAANYARAKIQQANPSKIAYLSYVFVLLALGAIPLVWIRQTNMEYSAMTVILVGVVMIWFAILVSRIYVQTPRQ
jgi:hypothetical protein